ncbi:MAG: lactonase family protein [Verrucomicrobia bacterium]|nr:lactonase family protein [Verrucomicrobiota bacterium]
MNLSMLFGAAGLSLVLGADLTAAPARAPSTAAKGRRVYFGTYTGPVSEGIYMSRLELGTGKLTEPVLAAKAVNPSFLAPHPHREFLYAVGEVWSGPKKGTVTAFRIEASTGALTELNQQPSGGAGPCHLSLDRTGKHLMVANYGGGSIAVLPVLEDGSLGEATAFVQHTGSSIHPQRQKEPHAHGIYTDAAARFVFVPDLGLDKVMIYRLEAGKLIAHDPPFARVRPGAGPRHFALHPSERFAYVINELDSTVTGFRYDAQRGVLQGMQSVSTLPKGFDGKNTTAEIEVHPTGKFLYGSNRGHDSLAVYSMTPETGMLTLVEHEPTLGKTPRGFGIDPAGRWLVAANQQSDTVVVFRIDPQTGALEPTGQTLKVGAPVCVMFLPWTGP